jgi:uncharacterized protein
MRTAGAALRSAAAGLVLALAAVAVRADSALPIPPVARVADETGTLNAEQRGALDAKLAALEASKGSQIAVLIVPSTAPEDIESFSIRVVDAWKLGRKGVDDGVLLTVAKNDHRYRIEVGKGLEGAITDFDSKRIELEELKPRFRSGDFYGGINAAADRLIGLVNGEPLPPPPQPRRAMRGGSLQGLFPIVLIIALIGGPILRGLLGRPVGAVASGGIAGFITWAITATLGFAVAAGLVAFLFALLGGLGGGNRFGGGFGGFGGLGGGGFGGGGFGGGGFSGGGGGFSGGGASGSW